MNLMTWLTGKTLAELVKKGQLIPPEIKLPVYPASHYKKNWYEQGIPHGGVIGLTAIMMTMTWIVSINMVIAQFELHNKKHLELVFFLAVGYIAFLTPSNQLLLKGRMSGVIIYRYALLLPLFPLRWQRSVPCHQYSWVSLTKCSCCCLAGHCCFFPAYR